MADSDQCDATRELEGESSQQADVPPLRQPEQIGRYHVEKQLGKGGFGLVYLARDEQLDRPVAIKVPHAQLISQREDAEAYVAEARTVANLDHPNIVPVHDVGSSEDCPCFVVSKYVEGTDLATKVKESRPAYSESADLVATIAGALHYAHSQGIVHRDIKPGNILIGHDNKPYVVDFGLALREENIGKGPRYAGTPAYMSPEQARGEGHRVDGRSDIFSLGVVFYELLVGRQPFRGDTQAEVLEQVIDYEPRPLRQYDDRIPKELERICHKAMAKRASERYSTAKDFAEDLRYFLDKQFVHPGGDTMSGIASAVAESQASMRASTLVGSPASASSETGSSSDSPPIKIVPKGLRSFDAHDADFFLELLPGPRDRDGLPDSLRFWKLRIEETESDTTFSVALIYGPSGCGKSSLVKAGLLPRLADFVIPVHVDATPDETESRLLHGLRKKCPAVEDNLNLQETIAALRRGQGIRGDKKILIVLDQFEQWLHAASKGENAVLMQALRQCDGGRVQCIVMVRDDFWMAVTRFLNGLEVELVQGHNFAPVDLFPLRHAQNVLAAFGRAFGALPDDASETSKDQKDFLKQSVAGLAEEDKVICVRLSLFSEMMKRKPWTPATLKDVGGTDGVGVRFLEETFGTPTNPMHRVHQKAARAVLKALLPESGVDIKGHMKSYDELLEASGYVRQAKGFDDLVRILDGEIRLITPTDPEGVEADSHLESGAANWQKYYQLTHDYLVPSLREWLTQKQKETWRGRAELRLAERAALWNTRSEHRHLPSPSEYASIALLTRWHDWSIPQRKMMRAARRYYSLRGAAVLLIVTLLVSVGLRAQDYFAARSVVTALLSADIDQVPGLVGSLRDYRHNADRLLRAELERAADRSPEKLNTAIALLPTDPEQASYLVDRMLACLVEEFAVLRNSLAPHRITIADKLWRTLRDEQSGSTARFRAGMALAWYEPSSDKWADEHFDYLVHQLLRTNAEHWSRLRSFLSPIKDRLLRTLEVRFADEEIPDSQRDAAAAALADYRNDSIADLCRLASQATASQHRFLIPKLLDDPSWQTSAKDELAKLASQKPASDLDEGGRIKLGRERAAAAMNLMLLGDTAAALSAFEIDDDPESITQFIHGCRARGVRSDHLITALDQTGRPYAIYALLLALGEFERDEISEPSGTTLVERLIAWYRTHPSSSVHGACGWLLRQWGHEEDVLRVDSTPREYDPSGRREWYVQEIEVSDDGSEGHEKQKIYFTFIVFPPGEYTMGSPTTELSRWPNEPLHRVTLTRPLAISDREITWRHVLSIRARRDRYERWRANRAPYVQPDHALVWLSWHDAVVICRWLTDQAGFGEDGQCYPDPASLRDGEMDTVGLLRDGAPKIWPLDRARPGFRLPTDAEWEYVCRSGMRTAYGFGSDSSLLDNYGWYANNSGDLLHRVAQLRPSLRGLFDLHGNVFEWCHDGHNSELSDAIDPVLVDPDPYPTWVMRGGAWIRSHRWCRSAFRGPWAGGTNRLGFRVALDPSVSQRATPSADKR